MNRTPVESSMVASVGYDAASETMEVEFPNGALYQYHDVPEAEYTQMMGAVSVGRYFGSNVRNTYKYTRI